MPPAPSMPAPLPPQSPIDLSSQDAPINPMNAMDFTGDMGSQGGYGDQGDGELSMLMAMLRQGGKL
jgi:hypothetical protein